jgi:hypothetical protein
LPEKRLLGILVQKAEVVINNTKSPQTSIKMISQSISVLFRHSLAHFLGSARKSCQDNQLLPGGRACPQA